MTYDIDAERERYKTLRLLKAYGAGDSVIQANMAELEVVLALMHAKKEIPEARDFLTDEMRDYFRKLDEKYEPFLEPAPKRQKHIFEAPASYPEPTKHTTIFDAIKKALWRKK